MKTPRNQTAWARPATALAVVLGLGLTMASPASAAPGDATSAFGISATGPVTVTPTAPSAFDSGTSPNTVGGVNVLGISSGINNTTATASDASSEVNNTSVALSPTNTLTASVISSSCSFDEESGAVSGDSSIVNGAVSVLGGTPITLDANAAPNTEVVDPALAGIATITLNRQTTDPNDGTLTVDAIYITLLGATPALTQTITIASSTCTPGTVLGVSMLPMSSAVGASVLGLSGLVFFAVRRRQTQPNLIEG